MKISIVVFWVTTHSLLMWQDTDASEGRHTLPWRRRHHGPL